MLHEREKERRRSIGKETFWKRWTEIGIQEGTMKDDLIVSWRPSPKADFLVLCRHWFIKLFTHVLDLLETPIARDPSQVFVSQYPPTIKVSISHSSTNYCSFFITENLLRAHVIILLCNGCFSWKNISTLESLRDRKSLHVVHLASNYTKLTYQIWLKIAFYPWSILKTITSLCDISQFL